MTFKKFRPNDYVMVIRNGAVVREGIGLSVLYNNMTTNLVVAPSTAFDGSFAFDDLVTSDYQRVYVQGVTTYMITDYAKASAMLDFSYSPNAPMDDKILETMAVLEKRINNIIKAIVIKAVSKCDVRTIIRLSDQLAGEVAAALSRDESIEKLGVSITSVNILGISPTVETRKALEAAAREEILKEQDDAIYKRRNAAIEQERLIKENEINTEIKVAEKEQEKEEKEQEMKQAIKLKALRAELALNTEKQEKEFDLQEKATAKKLLIEKQEMLGKIELEKKNKEYTELEAENARIKADQEAYAVEGIVRAYNNLNVALVEACAMAQTDPATLMAKAFMNIGENAGKIENFNITPDLLKTIVSGLGSDKGTVREDRDDRQRHEQGGAGKEAHQIRRA